MYNGILNIVIDEWKRVRNSTEFHLQITNGNATIWDKPKYKKQYEFSEEEPYFEDLARSIVCTAYLITHPKKAYQAIKKF